MQPHLLAVHGRGKPLTAVQIIQIVKVATSQIKLDSSDSRMFEHFILRRHVHPMRWRNPFPTPHPLDWYCVGSKPLCRHLHKGLRNVGSRFLPHRIQPLTVSVPVVVVVSNCPWNMRPSHLFLTEWFGGSGCTGRFGGGNPWTVSHGPTCTTLTCTTLACTVT